MNQSIGLDFGTSNTLIALSDESTSISLPEFARLYTQGDRQIELIPSLIHYAADGRRWIGSQVLDKDLYSSNRTLRWMKRYISQRSPLKMSLDGREITPASADADFLATLLGFTRAQMPVSIDSIGMSVPVDAYEHYETWLTGVIHQAGFSSFRLIDEPSAAALGYGEHIQPGSVYLVFDFGGGTLHAGVVIIEEENKTPSSRRCRVLGKASREIGGSSIDRWLYEYVLSANGLSAEREEVRLVSNQILVACERAKEVLSLNEQAQIDFDFPGSASIQTVLTRQNFEEILERRQLFFEINQTLRSALNSARERGYPEESIQSILMVGGSSLIPAVRKSIQQSFGPDRVHADRPMDAIVRGAARLAGGANFYDFIQHDYAIRFTNPDSGEYAYKTIVQKGTPYPSAEAEAVLSIKGAFDGQQKLGIAIFEVGASAAGGKEEVELVFDPQGYARIMPVTALDQEKRSYFWMNENQLTFIEAFPPALQGEPRFEVKFYINQNKQLLVSVVDLKRDCMVLDRTPVVKLS